MKRCTQRALLTVLAFAFSLSLRDQTPDTATIHGQVVDQSHGAVAGVLITARNTLTGLQRTAPADTSGSFSLAGLPIAGLYDVTASKPGFAEARLSATQMEDTPLLGRRITYLPLLNAANRPAIDQGDVFMNGNLFTTNGARRRYPASPRPTPPVATT